MSCSVWGPTGGEQLRHRFAPVGPSYFEMRVRLSKKTCSCLWSVIQDTAERKAISVSMEAGGRRGSYPNQKEERVRARSPSSSCLAGPRLFLGAAGLSARGILKGVERQSAPRRPRVVPRRHRGAEYQSRGIVGSVTDKQGRKMRRQGRGCPSLRPAASHRRRTSQSTTLSSVEREQQQFKNKAYRHLSRHAPQAREEQKGSSGF